MGFKSCVGAHAPRYPLACVHQYDRLTLPLAFVPPLHSSGTAATVSLAHPIRAIAPHVVINAAVPAAILELLLRERPQEADAVSLGLPRAGLTPPASLPLGSHERRRPPLGLRHWWWGRRHWRFCLGLRRRPAPLRTRADFCRSRLGPLARGPLWHVLGHRNAPTRYHNRTCSNCRLDCHGWLNDRHHSGHARRS